MIVDWSYNINNIILIGVIKFIIRVICLYWNSLFLIKMGTNATVASNFSEEQMGRSSIAKFNED